MILNIFSQVFNVVAASSCSHRHVQETNVSFRLITANGALTERGALKIERTGIMSHFLSCRLIYLLTALLLGTAPVTSHGALAAGENGSSSSVSHHPDLDYL